MPERSFPLPVLRNKQRCPYVSLYLDCHVGGDADVDCFRPEFHEGCHHRKKAERRYDEKGDAKA
jgi:hypothetical protein